MANVSSVEIRLGGQAPACVLDAELALSPFGLLLALRLAQEWRVWLSRSLWPMIDSYRLFDTRPHLVMEPDAASGDEIAELLTALGDWHQAWQGARINGRFHWIGDHRHESDLPDDADEFLPQRFEMMAEALIGEEPCDDEAGWSWRRTCGFEALALAGALSQRPTLILTSLRPGDREPRLVSLWQERANRPSRALPGLNGAAPVHLPPWVKVGLPPLLADEITLCAVHVAAPRAAVLPYVLAGDDLWASEDHGGGLGEAPDPWAGATLAWHPMT
jgi:hypothetical protein